MQSFGTATDVLDWLVSTLGSEFLSKPTARLDRHGPTLTEVSRKVYNREYIKTFTGRCARSRQDMLKRCREDPAYRTVEVCEEWLCDSDGLKQWRAYVLKYLGACRHDYSLDRIDPYGHYAPGNVRWACKHTQALNKRTTSKDV